VTTVQPLTLYTDSERQNAQRYKRTDDSRSYCATVRSAKTPTGDIFRRQLKTYFFTLY